jgi:SAM-dependent methyltransferase
VDLALWLLPLLVVVTGAVGYFVFASFSFGAGYQPAPRAVVTAMLDFAQVRPGDRLFDLGAGTGAIVFRAARERGAQVVAVEVEPVRIMILRVRRWWGARRELIDIRWGNLYRVDLSTATVVATFLWPEAMARLRPKLERELVPGTRIVSHWHPIPGWPVERSDPDLRVYFYRWNGADALGRPAPAQP